MQLWQTPNLANDDDQQPQWLLLKFCQQCLSFPVCRFWCRWRRLFLLCLHVSAVIIWRRYKYHWYLHDIKLHHTFFGGASYMVALAALLGSLSGDACDAFRNLMTRIGMHWPQWSNFYVLVVAFKHGPWFSAIIPVLPLLLSRRCKIFIRNDSNLGLWTYRKNNLGCLWTQEDVRQTFGICDGKRISLSS